MQARKSNVLKAIRILAFVLVNVVTAGIFLLAASIRWGLSTWNNLEMSQLVYELKAPLTGTGNVMLSSYALNCIVPTVLYSAVLIALNIFGRNIKKKMIKLLIIGSAWGFCIIMVISFWNRLDVGAYLRARATASKFIEENYVDPSKVQLDFPQKKRNLVYIYLESMEMTYADKKSGGAFEQNVIPELTKLSLEYENFSGSDEILNGGFSMPGTDWTMGAMFAQTSGLPLQIDIDDNSMDTQESFFGNITSLGDILENQGYNQVLMLGSDAVFGGRELFFTEHGNYFMHDYKYALSNQLIPENYYVWWGYEDEKLFSFAKEELCRLAKEDKPFNFTMLTADTHFPDGYICPLCEDEFDSSYANVMHCSSIQTVEFIRWIQQQDFYEDTTIVICGDHPTMDGNFCAGIESDYVRKVYTAFINSSVEPSGTVRSRDYMTIDFFPTTLAAMGVQIKGEKLGLGTNLFSDEPTLTEIYGRDQVAEELLKKSEFLSSMAKIDAVSDRVREAQGTLPSAEGYMKDSGNNRYIVGIRDVINVNAKIKKAEAEYRIGEKNGTLQLKLNEDGSYETVFEIENLDKERMGQVDFYITMKTGAKYMVHSIYGDLYLQSAHYDYAEYLSRLADCNDTILMAAKDDVSGTLTDDMTEGMALLGIKSNLTGHFRSSFYAVIKGSDVIDDMGDAALSYEGTLSDGKRFAIKSAGMNWGNYASIRIESDLEGADAEGLYEYTQNKDGMNIVIYDDTKGEVVDSVYFHLSQWNEFGGITLSGYDAKRNKAVATFQIPYDRVVVNVWAAEHPENVIFTKMEKENDALSGEINLTGIKGKFYLTAYYVDNYNNYHCVSRRYYSTDLLKQDDKKYIKYLSDKKEEYELLIAVSGNLSANVTIEQQQQLFDLGIDQQLFGMNNPAYAAHIANAKVTESLNADRSYLKGMLENGDTYEIESISGEPGRCVIKINKVFWTAGDSGVNLVVYDNQAGKVIDSVAIDQNGKLHR